MPTQPYRRLLPAFSALLIGLAVPASAAAQTIAQFATRTETNAQAIDYAAIDKYIDVFAEESAKRLRFNFAASKDEGTDFLRQYAAGLAQIAPTKLRADEQLAYWLNLRNVLVLAQLSEDGGQTNLKRDRATPAAPGKAWTQKVVTVEGVELSIDDIERGIILTHWADPRVVYGLYQGAAGGPSMVSKGFRGATVWADLEAAGRRFLQTPAGLTFRNDTAELSAVFDWYAAVFAGDADAVRTHLTPLLTAGDQTRLAQTRTITYKEFSYRADAFVVRNLPQPGSGARPPSGS